MRNILNILSKEVDENKLKDLRTRYGAASKEYEEALSGIQVHTISIQIM